jgi:non-ribosomal peptide synthetase component F
VENFIHIFAIAVSFIALLLAIWAWLIRVRVPDRDYMKSRIRHILDDARGPMSREDLIRELEREFPPFELAYVHLRIDELHSDNLVDKRHLPVALTGDETVMCYWKVDAFEDPYTARMELLAS